MPFVTPSKSTTFIVSAALSLILLPISAQASCSLKQTACEASCKVRYFDDSFGKMGCMTKCTAERAACSTKEGASEAVEKTKDLIDD
ncbi:hypothetical protein [Oceanospirillum linum]|uniref:Uncharacterized protein n=1 Tax=Oceanospirillum linum TaxID=966 RepID=A0A1T1H9A2_OCELI|nr:hypothetical protein [Oceanospirillum linum]OOV86346.1 hypothetical protein BTA35_0214140 [Oceanospirillum linum]SEG48136.1 hypothetical protein SAMN04489856_11277 [Oleiphilus messinensis]SMP31216.1 hypothetical protein SAMN06264348_10894 [Oceanospirillum linum]